ncbi:SRPBCC family protein [Cuneatibacter caecimuris]|uniref:Uncharacterized protein n=1 Tax=Cuneatibacter caecimuris TaxID=1796618 RepID=A0A4Q7PS00_9FIRM|nr:hypothetical protein [Cuneatibacter caecimuris]RZT02050.1 hypothetical protein EV209_0154 [Cuneatibacter caecimuris]
MSRTMNPIKMMKLKNGWEQFKKRHPKFPPFLQAAAANGLQEGSVLEMTITLPDGRSMTANLKVQKEDLELLQELKDLQASR